MEKGCKEKNSIFRQSKFQNKEYYLEQRDIW